MLIKINTSDSRPLYEQIAVQVRSAINNGELPRGERLPAASELAGATGVNLHTVLRAYAELRDEGLIELRPRRGAVVIAQPPRERLIAQARSFVEHSRSLGLTAPEILDLIMGEL